jgi:flagellar motor switch protein FliG
MEREGELTYSEKAAIIISSLPADLASEVVCHLETPEIERLSNWMSRMGTVPSAVVDRVVAEFMHIAVQRAGSVSLGKEYTARIITKALGEDRAKLMVNKLSEGSGYRSLEHLEDLDPKVLIDLIRNEHPQTIALILCHLSPKKAGAVLPSLPEELRAEVILRISSLERIPPDVINEVAEMLESEVKSKGDAGHKLGGIKAVADILNQIDRSIESSLLAKIEEADPTMAGEIRQLMFVFDDLVLIDDRGVQEILKEVSSDDLAKALKTASEAVKGKIFKNMSERAVEMLNEDIENMGPMRLSEVEKAQQGITQIAMKLEEEGKIVVGGRGGEELLV